VIYENGEPWRNDDDRGKLQIHPPESLTILPAESSESKWEEWALRMRIWPCKIFLFILVSDVLCDVKFYDIERMALLPL
jgi:hypothetical protein